MGAPRLPEPDEENENPRADLVSAMVRTRGFSRRASVQPSAQRPGILRPIWMAGTARSALSVGITAGDIVFEEQIDLAVLP